MTEYDKKELEDIPFDFEDFEDDEPGIDSEKIDTLEEMIFEKYPKFDRESFPCVEIDKIEKGKYKPVAYVCNSNGCIVTEFIVGAIDRETETHGIWFVYDQSHGPAYAWHVLGLPPEKKRGGKK